MKKLFLLFFFMNIFHWANAQLTYVPDDAFEYYIEGVGCNYDNYVSTTLIQSVPTVFLPIEVQDLTGIEEFTNLHGLWIEGSNISIIDLSLCPNLSFSTFNSTGGLSLYIASCPFLTKIIMPPNEISFGIGGFEGCPYLTEIIFQNTNVIRNIDPNDNTSNNLIISCPSLTCLDLSIISDVKIGSSIVIMSNNALTGLNLKNGKCNKWSYVEISQNPLLTCVEVDNPAFCNNAQALGAWYFDCINNPLSQCSYSASCPNCIAKVDELPTVSISLYPNPTSSEITITSDKFTNEPYTLYDQMGRTVASGRLAGTSTIISLSTLSKGIYILKVEGAFESAIVVKE
jgi:hypothetical protein